jgi:hypothetical protein
MKDVGDFDISDMKKVKEDVIEALGFFKQPEGKEFLGLCGSFLHRTNLGPKSAGAQKSKDTKPSSEARMSAAAEQFKEMMVLSPEWTLVE